MKVYKHRTDILIIVLLTAIAAVWFAMNRLTAKKGNTVQIYSDNQLIAVYDININQTDTITTEYGTNTIEIKAGKVSVTEASCNNQVCVHHTPIASSNESIICLPNHLVIRIHSDTQSEVDDIAK